MPDQIVAKGSAASFAPHPEGQFVAQCVDLIDLGLRAEQYTGQPKRLTPKCALVFAAGEINAETGEAWTIAKEFTVSTSEKANLRKFLESWRGKKYTPDQVTEGVPLHKLCGNWALITVAHQKSRAERVYGDIAAIMGVPKQMAAALPTLPPYARAEYWATRKAEYAEGARQFRLETQAPQSDHDEEFDQSQQYEDDGADLPFDFGSSPF